MMKAEDEYLAKRAEVEAEIKKMETMALEMEI